jgi:hypothetical protein
VEKVLKFTSHAKAAADEARHRRPVSVAKRDSAVELLPEPRRAPSPIGNHGLQQVPRIPEISTTWIGPAH